MLLNLASCRLTLLFLLRLVVSKAATIQQSLDVLIVSVTAGTECANTRAVPSALKDPPASALPMEAVADVPILDVTKAPETSFSVPRTVEENAASLRDATSQLLGALVFVLHMVVGDAVRWRAATSQRNRRPSIA